MRFDEVEPEKQSESLDPASAIQFSDRSPEPILQFFEYAHLPRALQEVSAQFTNTAKWIVGELPRNPERTVALRKLLEAKDAAVRARLFK